MYSRNQNSDRFSAFTESSVGRARGFHAAPSSRPTTLIHNVNISVEVDGYVVAQIKFPNNMQILSQLRSK